MGLFRSLRRFGLLSSLVALQILGAAPPKSSGPVAADSPKKNDVTIYDFNLPNIAGAMTSLAQFKGKVLLIVNVASDSSLTAQYAGLESLYEKYKDQGLVVLGFPCNDFGAEEKEPEAKIKAFAENTYHVQFPMFSKVAVRGDDATPLFHFLSKEGSAPLQGDPHWNFTKFLVDRSGAVSNRFEPGIAPDDPDLLIAVEAALASKGSVAKPKSVPVTEEASGGERRNRPRE